MLSNIIFETYLLYKFNDVLQTLSHVNYQYLDISLANRIRGKRKRVEEKKGSFRNVYLKNPNSINLSVLHVEANQAFSELIKLFDSYDGFMMGVDKKVLPISTLLQVFIFKASLLLVSSA